MVTTIGAIDRAGKFAELCSLTGLYEPFDIVAGIADTSEQIELTHTQASILGFNPSGSTQIYEGDYIY